MPELGLMVSCVGSHLDIAGIATTMLWRFHFPPLYSPTPPKKGGSWNFVSIAPCLQNIRDCWRRIYRFIGTLSERNLFRFLFQVKFLKLEKTVYASNQRLWREGKGLRDLPSILFRRTKNTTVHPDTLHKTLI